ncbi:Lsr2 dimerization domain-containing protein [Amycolatopsis balhimycina]|uniref:Lsr2 dimerization domain-containing protein n=1 Tax=Amycolatopsis balhimycina TaxID=208443 RepID=UPI000367A56C|nr:histone-like nucleoid-structuring protein Lsr2 [Amycolatopsis balhimycina]
MAKNTAVQVLDDLTGEPAGETVGFGLDGIDYDIDLSFANAEALRGFLQRYADAGRRTGGRKNRPRLVPGAKLPRAKATAKTAKPVAGRAAAKKAEPVRTPAPKPAAKAKATTAKETPAKATRAKATAKAEPAKTTRVRKVAEPKKATPASTRKVPTVTFSAAE